MFEQLRKTLRKFWNPFSLQTEIDRLKENTEEYYRKLDESILKAGQEAFICKYAIGINDAIASATYCMIWTKDINGRMLSLNDPMKKQLFNLDTDLSWITDTELVECYEKKYGKTEKCNESSIIRHFLVNDDHVKQTGKTTSKLVEGTLFGKPSVLRIRKNVIRDNDLNVIGVIGISDDITDKITVLKKAILASKETDVKEDLESLLMT